MRRMGMFGAALVGLAMCCAASGCGGGGSMSMEELKRRAIRRPDAETLDTPAPAAAPVADQAALDQAAPIQAAQAPGPAEPGATAVAGTTISAAATAQDQPSPDSSTAPTAPIAGLVTVAKPDTPLSDEQRRQRTIDNLQRIAKALEAYRAKHNGYPPAAVGEFNRPLLSWRVAILPELGYEQLHKQFHFNEPWNSPHNEQLLKYIPEPFQSPERFDDHTNYLGVAGMAYAFHPTRPRPQFEFEDGVENTALVLEMNDDAAVPWTQPVDLQADRFTPQQLTFKLGGLREDGFFMIWGGGMVGRIGKDATAAQLMAMVTRDAGDALLYSDIHQRPLAEVAATTSAEVSASNDSSAGSSAPVGGADSPPAVPGTSPAAKLTPPDTVAYEAAVKAFRSLYEDRFKRARMRQERVALASEMLQKATQLETDPAAMFTLLKLVAKIASEAGDLGIARQAVDQLEQKFAHDAFADRLEIIRACHAGGELQSGTLADAALDALEDAIERDDFEAGREMHGLAVAAAHETESEQHDQRIKRLKLRLDNAQRSYASVVRALRTLEAQPEDPDASTAVGKYYGLIKDNWQHGLPFLAQGSHKQLAEAAQAELAEPRTAEEMASVADLWWRYGERSSADRRSAQLRAAYWYDRIMKQGGNGLPRVKAEIRLQEVAKAHGADALAEMRESTAAAIR